jgi:putative NADPH-quinone reductase
MFNYSTQWQLRSANPYQVYWQNQPGTVNDRIDVTWSDGNGHTYNVGGSHAQGRTISLLSTGVSLTTGQAAQATLPSPRQGVRGELCP